MIKMQLPTFTHPTDSPRQDPVPVGAPTALALPNSGAIVPWAPQGCGFFRGIPQFFGGRLGVVGAGDSQILVDVDQEGLAIGEMLQDRPAEDDGYPGNFQRLI